MSELRICIYLDVEEMNRWMKEYGQSFVEFQIFVSFHSLVDEEQSKACKWQKVIT